MESKYKIRNSNIELLRITAMFFIVAGHFISQSGNVHYSLSLNDYLIILLGSGARIAVNVFLLIGVWFMTDAEFRASRILKLYGQTIIYSVPLTLLIMLLRPFPISIKEAARGLMPFLGRGLWFVSAYITLIFFMPFLDNILGCEKRRLGAFIGLAFFFISFICTLPDKQSSYVLDTVWFLLVYLIVGYLKKYPLKIRIRNCKKMAYGGAIYLFMVSCSFLMIEGFGENFLIGVLGALCQQYLSDFKTIPNILCATLIVSAVVHHKPKNSRVINYISKATFTLYVIHQVPLFYPFLWEKIFHGSSWAVQHHFMYVFVVFFSLLITAIALDELRRRWVEPLWVNSRLFSKAEKWINRIYSEAKE